MHAATRDATVEICLFPDGLNPIDSKQLSIEATGVGANIPAKWVHFGVTVDPIIP